MGDLAAGADVVCSLTAGCPSAEEGGATAVHEHDLVSRGAIADQGVDGVAFADVASAEDVKGAVAAIATVIVAKGDHGLVLIPTSLEVLARNQSGEPELGAAPDEAVVVEAAERRSSVVYF